MGGQDVILNSDGYSYASAFMAPTTPAPITNHSSSSFSLSPSDGNCKLTYKPIAPTTAIFFPPSFFFHKSVCILSSMSMIDDHSPCSSSSDPATAADIVLYHSPPAPEIYTPQQPSSTIFSETEQQLLPISNYPQKPRKKRTKLTRIEIPTPSIPSTSAAAAVVHKPKYTKKPDPAAPKITRPCSECGKKFWSWKALFGHMRCHPERQWRGINPPPNFNRHDHTPEISLTEEDHDIAACLIMLANSPTTSGGGPDSPSSCRFECSSCKKVFGSHQALGGHRATHKNVKGCFANTRCDGEEIDNVGGGGGNLEDRGGGGGGGGDGEVSMVFGHQCSICLRVFSSGQALGGHKRCHWEKIDEPLMSQQGLIDHHNPFVTSGRGGGGDGGGLDLNMPPPVEDETLHPSCSANSGLVLDLRLGL